MTDTPAAPHTPSDDPRVDILAEHLVGYANWHRYNDDGRDAARFDAKGLLARLDAARDHLVDITIVEPAECAAHGNAADQCAQCVARNLWLDAGRVDDLASGGRHDQTGYDAGYSDGASAVEACLNAAAPTRDDALARWFDEEIDRAERKALRIVREVHEAQAQGDAGAGVRSWQSLVRAENRAEVLREVRDRLGATTNTDKPKGGQ